MALLCELTIEADSSSTWAVGLQQVRQLRELHEQEEKLARFETFMSGGRGAGGGAAGKKTGSAQKRGRAKGE